MKITPSMIFEVLKYWGKNGKTSTALITAVVIVVMQTAGLDIDKYGPEANELVAALVGAGVLGIIGVWHKIVKTVKVIKEQDAVK